MVLAVQNVMVVHLLYNNDNKFLYLFQDKINNLIKIGMSVNPEKRLLIISKNKDIILLKKYSKCSKLERILHKKYDKLRENHITCEDGKTEWFRLSINQLKNIDRYIKIYKIMNPNHK